MSGENILVTCGGRWVGMTLALRQAAQELGAGRVFVADRDPLTPAGVFSDGQVRVPAIHASDYVDVLVEVCTRMEVGVVVPLIDIDLERLAPHKQRFADCGVHLVAPPPDIVDLCLDKLRFDEFCREEGLPTAPRLDVTDPSALAYPVFCRPRRGFGSIGSELVRDEVRLQALLARGELIVQSVVTAQEVSVDAYVNREGRCTLLVPRLRDRVVGGEALRSHTIEEEESTALARRTVDALSRKGLRGPVNVQLFLKRPHLLIEVNTRLGSCSVLSNAATGGRLLRSILREAMGELAGGDPSDYERGLAVYRYTGDVFHSGESVRRLAPARSEAPTEFVE